MRIYQLFTTTAGAQSLSLQLVNSGAIVCVHWVLSAVAATAGNQVIAELSYQGVAQYSTNNPQGIISAAELQIGSAAATGSYPFQLVQTHVGLHCPVKTGDLIYLNTTATVTTSFRAKAIIHVQER